MSEIHGTKLEKLATISMDAAYAPYSKFRVGAALLTADGAMFGGCNVENRSLGLTMCAERVAIGAAICAGMNQFVKIALICDSVEPIVPCGACRQVLAEFNPELSVVSKTLSGQCATFSLAELLPRPAQGIL
ncbi:MAG: cytidine deaminase [Verrucomicrobiota bacterium]|nr:cytidine deaminase [Verrucomicrobiota bacterium]